MYGGLKDQNLIESILDLYKEGFSLKDVANAAGVGIPLVTEIVRSHGIMSKRGKNEGYRKLHPVTTNGETEIMVEQKREERLETLLAPAAEVALTKTKCPSCGNTEHLKGSAFCCKCGTKIETREQVLRRALRNLYAFASKAAGENEGLVKEDYDTIKGFLIETFGGAA